MLSRLLVSYLLIMFFITIHNMIFAQAEIAFSLERNGNRDLYIMDENGENIRRLTRSIWDENPSWSPDRSKIAFCRIVRIPEIWIIDVNTGEEWYLTIGYCPACSPSGRKIAFSRRRQKRDAIWVIDLESKEERILTDENFSSISPSWSPDGEKIIFSSDIGGQWDLWVIRADGSGLTQLTVSTEREHEPSWWNPGMLSINPSGKLSTTWGKIKNDHRD